MTSLSVQENVPLAPFTTLGVGGPARLFVEVRTLEELHAALELRNKRDLPLFILGGGSNLVISDDGFDGLVIRLALQGIVEQAVGDDRVELTAAAGEGWDNFVRVAVAADLAGVECLSGIPGLVGATPIQNVGAYGQEVAETIVRVELLDRETLESVTFTNSDCHFSYRQSVFKVNLKDQYIVTSVTFSLQRGGAPSIRYPDLQRYFDEVGESSPTLQQTRDGVIAVRKRKGMVLDPSDPDTRSDGSFFMNPIVMVEESDRFLQRARDLVGDARVPVFPAGDGLVKLSAAWLIEHAGFSKGLIRGNVGLSSKHSLAIINRGGATAREIVDLKEEIQQGVREKFGVELHPEPNFIGFA